MPAAAQVQLTCVCLTVCRYLLSAFTLCETYTIGVICAMYYENGNGMIVLQALMLTAAVFISLTVYTLTTKKVRPD